MFRGANGEETWNEPIEQDAKGNAANRVEDSEGNEDNEDGQWEAEDPVPENYEDDPDQQVEEETLYDSEKPTDTPDPISLIPVTKPSESGTISSNTGTLGEVRRLKIV